MRFHQPVLTRETLELLQPRAGGRYLDATVGGGGHAAALLEACEPDGELIGLDCDDEALAAARRRLRAFGTRVRLLRANYADLGQALSKYGWWTVNGVLFDLGVSSLQLDAADRGFSFRKKGPLDLRLDRRQQRTAEEIVNEASEEELTRILKTFGQERRARRIARLIVRRRARQRIATTTDLAEIISRVGIGSRGRADVAARIFQAFRIAVNRELENLERGLAEAVERLARGGRVAVLSFHSGEDRIVKHTLRRMANEGRLRVLTPKPIVPTAEEIAANPRARSAKLRAAERL